MQYVTLGDLKASRIVLGCMRIADKPPAMIRDIIEAALSLNINIFDHADIYGGGACETRYGEIFKQHPSLRQKMILQTKCGILRGYYDLSYKHIIESVDNSLKRLRTDCIDILLLHRPDIFMQPDQIARAFDTLLTQGKVQYFGVSNFSPAQIEYLKPVLNQRLLINQLQLELTRPALFSESIRFNITNEQNTTQNALHYCAQNNIIIQAWSPFQCSFSKPDGFSFSGSLFHPVAKEFFFNLHFNLEGLARKYNTAPETVAAAFILKHPSLQLVTGTTSPEHLKLIADAVNLVLTHSEWYSILECVSGQIP